MHFYEDEKTKLQHTTDCHYHIQIHLFMHGEILSQQV